MFNIIEEGYDMSFQANPMKDLSEGVLCKNREILFRGKVIETGEWVFGVPFNMVGNRTGSGMLMNGVFHYYKDDPHCYEFNHFEIDRGTMGEYTGYDTPYGERIFEDDVLHVERSTLVGHESIVVLVRRDESGYWELITDENDTDFAEVMSGEVSVEIIGNIHDNPELLNSIYNKEDNNHE